MCSKKPDAHDWGRFGWGLWWTESTYLLWHHSTNKKTLVWKQDVCMFACLPSTTLKCFSGEVAKQERHIAVTMVSMGRHDKTVIYINVSSATSFFLFLPVLAFSISLCFLFYLWFSRTSILSCIEITLSHTHARPRTCSLSQTQTTGWWQSVPRWNAQRFEPHCRHNRRNESSRMPVVFWPTPVTVELHSVCKVACR